MSCLHHTENIPDRGPIYVRENGELYKVNHTLRRIDSWTPQARPSRLLSKGFSIQLCRSTENDNGRVDHFIFTYTKEGNLRYSAKSLFTLVLSYVADNINHVDSLIGFPEQIAEKLFYAADARQKFTEPRTGLGALQKFTEAYGSLVLQKLCLKNGFLVVSEKLEEIKTFQGLTCLDLSFCKLGDEHDLLEHFTNRRLSSLTQLFLKDNCLSDGGLRKMTAPVRVMKRGLENLLVLDLSCNPGITNAGLRYLVSFRKLNYLDISGTGLKDTKAAVDHVQTQMGLIHSEISLEEFCHHNCKTEGWAEQTVLQWEHAAVEAAKPKEHLKSRATAQHFYGKRARREDLLKSSVQEREREMPPNLQFYKQRVEMLHFSLQNGNTEVNKGLQIKKQSVPEHSGRNFKSKQLSFSVADWDLLHSY